MTMLARRGMEAGGIGLSSGLYYAPAATRRLRRSSRAKIVGELAASTEATSATEADYSVGVVPAVQE